MRASGVEKTASGKGIEKTAQEKKLRSKKDNLEMTSESLLRKKDGNAFAHENLIYKLVLISLLVLIFYPPYLRGLFFEEEQLPTEILIFVVFSVYCINKIMNGEKRFLETPIEYSALALVGVYLLSLVSAVSLRLAVSEWLKYCMYFVFFFLINDIVSRYKSKLAVILVIIASAFGVCVIGIDGAAGQILVNPLNEFFKPFRSGTDLFFGLFQGERIYSTLQYPNALAAYLMAMIFVTTATFISYEKAWIKMVTAAVMPIYLVTFVNTISRGAYIIMPMMAFVFFLALPKGQRAKSTVYSIAAFIPSVAASVLISPYMSNAAENYSYIWGYLAAASIAAAVLVSGVRFIIAKIEGLSWKVYAGISTAAILALIIGIVYIFNSTEPLVIIGDSKGGNEALTSTRRGIVLKSQQRYKLTYNVEATASDPLQETYRITVISRSIKDILFEKAEHSSGSILADVPGKPTKGPENKEISFDVPADSEIVMIRFSNGGKDSKAAFYKADILGADNAGFSKSIVLKYKFIPDALVERLSDVQATKSGIERSIFYSDGLKMAMDHWLIGSGGGAWSVLNFSYQSYLYWSTQAHNYVLQLFIESGIVGIAVFILMLASFAAMYLLGYKNMAGENGILQAGLFTGILTLVSHAAIDFDFSLSAVFLLMWQLLALFNSSYRNGTIKLADEWQNKYINNLFSKIKGVLLIFKPLKLSYAAVLSAALIVLIIPSMLYMAISRDSIASQLMAKGNGNAALQIIKEAVSLDPINAEYRITDSSRASYARLLRMTKNPNDYKTADNQVAIAEKLGRYNPKTAVDIASYYLSGGNAEKGLAYVDHATKLRPMRPEEWHSRIQGYTSVITAQFKGKDTNEALKNIDKVLSFINEIKEVNKRNMNPFILAPEAQEMVEKLKYIKDNIHKQKEINFGKIVFYNIPEMDLNEDGIPDQWSESKPGEVQVKIDNEIMVAESKVPGEIMFIQSRALVFQPGKTYKIEVMLEKPEELSSIPFVITGVSEKNEGLKPVGDIFTAEFTTPGNFKAGVNTARIGINGRYGISDIQIIEK